MSVRVDQSTLICQTFAGLFQMKEQKGCAGGKNN
jgi:hypothetical protein